MAAPTQAVSKSAKKKAAAKAAVERTASPAPSTTSAAADKSGEGQDSGFETPYIKEIQKTIRNVTKKITNASKTDSILAANTGKTLDELVDARIINADQKAQILKKPALQAQIAQLEEQLAQYKQVHDQYQAKAATDKADWDNQLESAKAEAVASAEASFKEQTHQRLLLISQFLRLAAARREEAEDPESDESQAIEGVLLAIYSGDDNAVAALLKLVNGSDDTVLSVPGEQLETTYGQVKALSQEHKNLLSEEAQPTENTSQVETDPTVANATATEIEAGDATALPANGGEVEAVTNGIANASVADDAANAVAESHWDTGNDGAMSQDWVDVKVPRDPAETETGLTATPAAVPNTQSWADEQPDPVSEPAAPADPNDGFHQVQRKGPRHEREGSNWRGGRGGRGDFRGRGRGDGRGRGRGRGNGNGGNASRGPRRNEEA